MNDPKLPFDLLERQTVEPGAVIFVEGQKADRAYVILRGEVHAVAESAQGAPVTLRRMGAGEMFGEIGLLKEHGKRTATIASEHGCELLVIPRQIFDERLGTADPLLKFIIEHLCHHLLSLTERYVGRG